MSQFPSCLMFVIVLLALLSASEVCAGRSRLFNEMTVASPSLSLVQAQCSSLYGLANANSNFNDSTKFTASVEFPEDIDVFYGNSRTVGKTDYFPINQITTTYAFSGQNLVTVTDGSANSNDYETSLVLARGDFINNVTINYNLGQASGTLGAVYGLVFNTFCNCSASIGYFDGTITKTSYIGQDWALEYFYGTVNSDSNGKGYIAALGFCYLQQAPPACPANPCQSFGSSQQAEVTGDAISVGGDRDGSNSETVLALPSADSENDTATP